MARQHSVLVAAVVEHLAVPLAAPAVMAVAVLGRLVVLELPELLTQAVAVAVLGLMNLLVVLAVLV
jgi:hypothetical protein